MDANFYTLKSQDTPLSPPPRAPRPLRGALSAGARAHNEQENTEQRCNLLLTTPYPNELLAGHFLQLMFTGQDQTKIVYTTPKNETKKAMPRNAATVRCGQARGRVGRPGLVQNNPR